MRGRHCYGLNREDPCPSQNALFSSVSVEQNIVGSETKGDRMVAFPADPYLERKGLIPLDYDHVNVGQADSSECSDGFAH